MKKYAVYFLNCLVILTALSSCKKDESIEPEIPEFVFAGGEMTIFDATSNAFAMPAPNLSPDNFTRHLEGDLAFEQIFVTAPADLNAGLGPVFNNNSCVSCHIKNGRSKPALTGEELSGFLIRLSVEGVDVNGGPKPVPFFGTQLQNRAVFGVEKEANFTALEIEKIVEFVDGSSVNLMQPQYTLTEPYQPLPGDLMISPRVAPAVFGLGLLEAVSEETILSYADENDENGDGISGKPNMVWNVKEQALTLGRFGWKAENPTGLQQTADAFHQDMGITSSMFLEESCADQPNCQDDGIADIDDTFLERTSFYFQSLAVPAVRNYIDKKVIKGQELFKTARCSDCHIPKHTTGTSPIPELSNQTIYPYTDLLLHDMGEGLADNRPSFQASGREWRTPPLWGIGLLPVVNGHTRLLHDGRARNIEEAILWHGGEGEFSKQAFLEMSEADRKALIAFLEAL